MAQLCTDYLEQPGVQISVSAVASPWQNGYCASFFGRFKHEIGDLNRFDTPGQMIEAIYAHIHNYNTQRLHTALKMTPLQWAQGAAPPLVPRCLF
ncbi:transposase [bacterium]|nr:transposase [bacterium]